jgi:hypothetical protein
MKSFFIATMRERASVKNAQNAGGRESGKNNQVESRM